MTQLRLLALLALFLLPMSSLSRPVVAQDGCGAGDDDEGFIDDDDPIDEAEVKRKNVGLAGGGPDADDPLVPKVQAPLQQRINEAIKKGVEWLKKAQHDDGSWGPVTADRRYDDPSARGHWARDATGPTSFSMYALSKCEVKSTDPVMKKGYRWLQEGAKPKNGEAPDARAPIQWGPGKAWDQTGNVQYYNSSTYESAALVMLLETMHTKSKKNTGKHDKRNVTDNPLQPPRKTKFAKDDWLWMHERVVWLTTGLKGGAKLRGGKLPTIKGCQNPGGGWRYSQANGDQDLSATQFVLLGLRAASQAGYPVERVHESVWRDAAEFVRSCQLPEGGFGYQKGGGEMTGSMTACGIASLVICKEQMELAKQPVPEWIDDSIKRGLDSLDKTFDAGHNPGTEQGGGSKHHYYYLYGVERVGDLTGRTEFNGKNWYVRGAELLLEQQAADGSWTDPQAFTPRDVVSTCYALLFLKRATPPTVTYSGD